jgi:hypothetical protein
MDIGKSIVVAAAMLSGSYLFTHLHIVEKRELKVGESSMPAAYIVNTVTGSAIFCQPTKCSSLDMGK